jgi:hypothetical protein
MGCKLANNCTCTGRSATLRLFCPHWSELERPRGVLDNASDMKWVTVPAEDRKRCLDRLRSEVPPEVIAEWRATYQRGNVIGSADIRFHLGVGMAVRNCLRGALLDDKLPGAPQLHWDDYYMGALNELVSTTP